MTTKLTADQVREFLKRPGIHLPGIAREHNVPLQRLKDIKYKGVKTLKPEDVEKLATMMEEYGEYFGP